VTQWLNILTAVACTALATSLAAVFATRSARQRGIQEGKREALIRFRRDQEAAVHLFLCRLTNLVTRSCDERSVPARAQSILNLVQSFQTAVAGVGAPIADDLARLERALIRLQSSPADAAAEQEVRDALAALRTEWPDKRRELETVIRGLLAQLSTVDDAESARH